MVKQAINQYMVVCMNEEVFTAERCTLQVDSSKLKREKAGSARVLLEKQCKELVGLTIQPPLCQHTGKEYVYPAHKQGH